MTATDETGQTKGGGEEVKLNGSTKLEEKTSTEPGSLAERPMGDAPPPKNEDLADDVAPTFEVSLPLFFSVPTFASSLTETRTSLRLHQDNTKSCHGSGVLDFACVIY